MAKSTSPKMKESYPDKFHVQLTVRDKKMLTKLVEKYVLDLAEGQESGKDQIQAIVYATEEQIAALKKENIPMKVGANQSAIGRQRQGEVSKEDRFAGGKNRPKGLGTKK